MPSSIRTHFLLYLISVCSFLLILLDRMTGFAPLRSLTTGLYTCAILIAAFALLLGLLNVVWIHARRIVAGEREWVLSLILILTLVGTLAAGWVATDGVFSLPIQWLFDHLLAPGQAALFALLPFFLLVAAYRHLRIDKIGGTWMLAGVLAMTITQMPSAAQWLPAAISATMIGLLEGPVTAALRGVLIGSSLAIVIAGVRFLLRKN